MAQVIAPSPLGELEQQTGSYLEPPSCSVAIVPARECTHQWASARATGTAKSRAPDHRYEGIAIGAGLGVLGGTVLGLEFCSLSEDRSSSLTGCVIGAGLGMGILTGFVGMMIGAQFPKEAAARDSTPADSTAAPPDSTY